MIIEKNCEQLRKTKAQQTEKINKTLDWLLEFRFSSSHVIARRLGFQRVNDLSRFFKYLVEKGFVKTFSNIHTGRFNYFILTAEGVSFLEAHGRDTSRSTTRVANLGKYKNVLHDICVQQIIVDELSKHQYESVVWDRNITLSDDSKSRPDAVVETSDNVKIAIEYERWRKEPKRIYHSFYNHSQEIIKGVYQGVYLYFHAVSDMKKYQAMFKEESWPLYKKNIKNGKLQESGEFFKPDSIENLSKCFYFFHFEAEIY